MLLRPNDMAKGMSVRLGIEESRSGVEVFFPLALVAVKKFKCRFSKQWKNKSTLG